MVPPRGEVAARCRGRGDVYCGYALGASGRFYPSDDRKGCGKHGAPPGCCELGPWTHCHGRCLSGDGALVRTARLMSVSADCAERYAK